MKALLKRFKRWAMSASKTQWFALVWYTLLIVTVMFRFDWKISLPTGFVWMGLSAWWLAVNKGVIKEKIDNE